MDLQCCCICTQESRAAVENGVKQFASRAGRGVGMEWFQTGSELYQRLNDRRCDVVIVALPGAAGMEDATRSRELAPGTPLIWCSDDKDFAIHSYRLKAAMFLRLPIRAVEISEALARCLLDEYSEWDEVMEKGRKKLKERTFHLEDLELPVTVYLDERSGKDLYDYPVFFTNPVYTGTGRPCVNAWQDACAHIRPVEGITVKSMDCGCCSYYRAERERDLIGVCMCEDNRVLQEEVEEERT